jgi:sialic acid synthase SpsE
MDDLVIKGTGGLAQKASPCLIIAEAGVNHNGSLKLALELVDVAVAARADIVKFQTFTTEKVMSKVAKKAKYQGETNESQLELVKKLELTEADFREIAAYCKQKGIEFLSTGFDSDSIAFLESLNPRLYKIPSGEITHDALIRQVAGYGKPIILSTGMAEMDEIERALSWIGPEVPVTLLQCVSAYPAAHSDLNLRAMATMAERFNLPIGLSDHSLGISASVAAVALGATGVRGPLVALAQRRPWARAIHAARDKALGTRGCVR